MRSLIVLILPFLLMGCQVAEVPHNHLVVSGSPALTPLAQDIAQRFQRLHPGVHIDLASVPADSLVADTRQGLVDVALVGRALRASETDLRGTILAQDGIAFIVHGSNPVPPLDERQLVNLLTRSYTDWREVGGSAGPVSLIGLGDGVDLRESVLLRFGLAKTSVRLDPPPLYRDDQVIEAVANNPSALGYVSLAAALKPASVQAIRILPQAGAAATLENLSNGLYPYTRPLMLVTRLQTDDLAREFIEFASSPEVFDLITTHGYATLQP